MPAPTIAALDGVPVLRAPQRHLHISRVESSSDRGLQACIEREQGLPRWLFSMLRWRVPAGLAFETGALPAPFLAATSFQAFRSARSGELGAAGWCVVLVHEGGWAGGVSGGRAGLGARAAAACVGTASTPSGSTCGCCWLLLPAGGADLPWVLAVV